MVGTAVAADVLSGKTFTNSSNICLSGSMTNVGEQNIIITPSTTSQKYTIYNGYHNGKGNISVNPIPSSYVDISSGVTVFLNGTLDERMLPQGFKFAKTGNTATYNSNGVWFAAYSSFSQSDINYQRIITGNTIDLTPFKTLTIGVDLSHNSSADRVYYNILILNSSYSSSRYNYDSSHKLLQKYDDERKSKIGTIFTLTLDISNINEHAFIAVNGSTYDNEEGSYYYNSGYLTQISLS